MFVRNLLFSIAGLAAAGLALSAQTGYEATGGYDPGYANAYPQQNQGYPNPPYQGQYPQSQRDAEDQPGRPVARISVMNGDVSVRRADAGDVFAAAVNAPLMVQDDLTTGPSGRAEVQLDYAHRARLGPDAEMRISNLEPNRFQLQLSRGFLTYSIIRDSPAQAEISTPVASVRPLGRSQVRVWVREDGETTITARSGEVEVFTPRGTERLRRGQSMLLRGNPQDPEYQVIAAQGYDQWDGWNDERDRALERSVAYSYVNPDIVGAEDLDSYGRWDSDPQYGRVWVPRVAADWTPYHEGRWAWEDYYGWTWVSSEPWGWAPYHYGNWYHAPFGWAWYPGERYHHTWYRPALVGFFGFGGGGGFDLGIGFGNVGWCPLAPYEVYHPWYARGGFGGGWGDRGGFGRNLTIINNTNITNIYRNAEYGALSANAQQFVNGGARYSRVNDAQLRNATFVRGQLPITPTAGTLRFSDRQTAAIPRTNFANSRFYSRSPVNQQFAARVPFQQQQQVIQQSARSFAQSGGVRTFVNQPGQAGLPGSNGGFVRQNGQAIYRGGTGPMQNGQVYGRGSNGLPLGNQNGRVYGRGSNGLPLGGGNQSGPVYGRGTNGMPLGNQNGQVYGRGSNGLPLGGGNQNGQVYGRNSNIAPGMPNGQSYGRLNPGVPAQSPIYRNTAPSSQPGIAQPQTNSNWSRFGQPNRAGSGAYPGSPAPQGNQGNAPGGYGRPQMQQPAGGWNRFGNAPRQNMAPRAPMSSVPPQGYMRPGNSPQYNSPGPSQQSLAIQRSLQLSQPVVRPRDSGSYNSPAYQRPSASGNPAPAYRQPYSAPSYQAPPQYRAPAYNPPAYRQQAAPVQQQHAVPFYRPQPQAAPNYRSMPAYSAPAPRAPQSYSAPREAPGRSYGPAPRPSSGGGGRSPESNPRDRHR